MGRRVPTLIALAAVMLGGCVLFVDTTDLAGGANTLAGDAGNDGADVSAPSTEAGPTLVADAGSRKVLVTAGGDHSCAAIDGTAFCWGRNTSGELGDGTKTNAPAPVRVQGLPGPVTAIAAGHTHTCAIVGGEVWCWGSNSNGALGPNGVTDSVVPVKMEGLSATPLDIGAGEQFTCVLTSDGRINCWGSNGHGRLGDGSPTSHKTASSVVDANGIRSDFAKLAVCADHACAVTTAGDPFCWGHNDNGALGNTSAGEDSARALPVEGLPGKVQGITIGGWHACAIVDGGAFCWGTGSAGELGNGGTAHSTAPVPVIGHASGVVLIATGGGPDEGDSTCALRDGMVSCWGNGNNGRLGDGQTASRGTPVGVTGLPGPVTALAAGAHHWCASIANGDVVCWGRGREGQVGDGASIDRYVPMRVNLSP